MSLLRLALCQVNATVGDLDGNAAKIAAACAKTDEAGADVAVFPELALCGYPPEDLLIKPHFLHDCRIALDRIAAGVGELHAIVGFPEVAPDGKIYNAAALLHSGGVKMVYRKVFLPNYGVFDEQRYFEPGHEYPVIKIKGTPVGLTVCQDIWEDKGPASRESTRGARLIININASPYHIAKGRERELMLRDRAVETGAWLVYVNLVGGQDELVFDGQSMVVRPDGSLLTQGAQFKEDMLVVDIDAEAGTAESITAPVPPLGEAAEIYEALVLGVRDYMGKNGFQAAVLGLSGGIDSALAASIAADAVGADNVKTVFLPARFSSADSREDAAEIAANLGAEFREIDIDAVFEAYLATLRPYFGTLPFDVAEENLQARVRGTLLMALANKFKWIVLATGNKSEMAVGYATLYGDMAGGFEVIKDVPKTLVYKLAAYRNSLSPAIPDAVLRKAPTAELRPDQKDTDSLPAYEILDPIINAYVEQDLSPDEIEALGFERPTVDKVVRLIDTNEYKRRQAPPGIKITPKAFGKDRRLPITNHYRG
jgi:NAD+ synthase (glutamine-hydrolysing)